KSESLGTPTRNLVYHPDEIPCQARDDIGKVMRFRIRRGMTTLLVVGEGHPPLNKSKSLGTPTRNLVYHPDEIPCQARDDIGKVMRFRIRRGMTTLLVVGEGHPPLKKTKSLRAPTRNLVYHPDEIPCQARDDIGKV